MKQVPQYLCAFMDIILADNGHRLENTYRAD